MAPVVVLAACLDCPHKLVYLGRVNRLPGCKAIPVPKFNFLTHCQKGRLWLFGEASQELLNLVPS